MQIKHYLLTAAVAASVSLAGLSHRAGAQQIISRPATQWHGFEQVNFMLDSIRAYYVKPRKALAGNPWIWRAHFPDWHIEMDSLLLARGFHVAYIYTNNEYGAPRAMMTWDRFYQYLTGKLSFARKVALEGVSRGGLYVYNWAKRNPDKVSCIYGEAPVCDFKSWPAGKGKGVGAASSWRQLLEVYGFTETQAMDYKDNPIDHLEGLAAFKVPILHVIGLQDQVVPPDENTFVLVNRYTRLGGPATIYPMTRGKQELEGHHFEIAHADRWADFIFRCSYPVKNPLPYDHYYHLRRGISHFYEKVTRSQPVTVAFLGGSITHNPGWRNLTCQYLRERFPRTHFHFIAAGIPSLGSLPHAFRVGRDVLDSGKVDLMFVEAAVNDRVNGTDSLTQVRALEGIVRHAKMNNPRMDIILMSFADPDKLKDYAHSRRPVAVYNHELVARHYGLPSINLAREVYDKIGAGEFSWQYDFKGLHPAAYGQQLYAQTIKSLLVSCLNPSGNQGTSGRERTEQLPAPLDKWNFDEGSYLGVSEARLGKGWELREQWRPADHTATRPGFVNCQMLTAKSPGATLRLTFRGTAIGMAIVSGPDAGIVRYRVDQGATRTVDLYTPWSHSLYLPWYILFDGALKEGKHTLYLTLTGQKNEKSRGTACDIAYFLVNR